MARENSSLSNVFDNLKGNKNIQAEKERIKKEKETPIETKTSQPSSIPTPDDVESLSNDIEDVPDVTEEQSIEPPYVNETEIEIDDSINEELDSEDASNPFGETLINKFNEKKRKPTIEESHTRNTLFVRNDLHKRMTKLTKNRRGLKTMLVNEAIEAVLDAVEGNKK